MVFSLSSHNGTKVLEKLFIVNSLKKTLSEIKEGNTALTHTHTYTHTHTHTHTHTISLEENDRPERTFQAVQNKTQNFSKFCENFIYCKLIIFSLN